MGGAGCLVMMMMMPYSLAASKRAEAAILKWLETPDEHASHKTCPTPTHAGSRRLSRCTRSRLGLPRLLFQSQDCRNHVNQASH